MMKPTSVLHKLGQSLWLDNITRELLNTGTLQRFIDEFSVTGLTSNPTIFDHAIRHSGTLLTFAGRVSDSGEGRWTVKAAIDEGVPAHVLSSALYERFSSRGEADFADKLLSAMRYEFGGHLEKQA